MEAYQGVLSALGEEQRLRIVERLASAPASVGELAQELPISRPAVSQHLRVLQQQALVSHHAAGTRNIYRVEPAGFSVLRDWLDDIWSAALDSFVQYATDKGSATAKSSATAKGSVSHKGSVTHKSKETSR